MAVSATDPRANAQSAADWKAAGDAAAADRARRKYGLGAVLDHVAIAAGEIGRRFKVSTIGGWRASATDPNGHPAGRALDIMVTGQKGTRINDWLIANRGALAVEYTIWEQNLYSDRTRWKPERMDDRGSPTANHMDHVHANFHESPGKGTAAGLTPGGAAAGGGGGGAATSAELQDTLQKVAVTGLFILAGAGLVVAGMGRTVQPAVKAAGDAATSAATRAASMAGPQGKAAAAAASAGKGRT